MELKELYQEIILDHGRNHRSVKKSDNLNKEDIDILCNAIDKCKKVFNI